MLEPAPFVEALFATVLLGVDLRAALAERDLARVDAALLAAAERERALDLLLRPGLDLARERGVESAMVSPPGIG
ncbi:MAG: hypothetical protein ACJ768_07715 [Gaiellaceae bacterium]